MRRIRGAWATPARKTGWIVLSAAFVIGVLLTPSAAERAKCMGERATIVGTNGPERLVGTNGKDVIVAKSGADYILAKASEDLICSGDGDDHVDTGNGFDKVRASTGDDSLVGGERTKLLDGGHGRDIFFTRGGKGGTIRGGPGGDWLTFVDRRCTPVKVDLGDHKARYRNCARTKTRVWTVRGVEAIEGGPRRDHLVGGEFGDLLLGHERGDELDGRAGNDRALAGGGADLLRGAGGSDWLNGGTEFDKGRGGAGSDHCIYVERRRSC